MRNRKWLIVSLVVSVAVNLALAGFVAGRMSHPGPVPAMLDPSLSLFRVIRELPDDRRAAFRGEVREHFRAMRGDLRHMREAQRGINLALGEEPFDPDALDQALAAFRAALLQGQQLNHALLVRMAGSMTPEERYLLREAMTRRHSSYRRDGHRPSGPDGPDSR